MGSISVRATTNGVVKDLNTPERKKESGEKKRKGEGRIRKRGQ